MSDSDTHTEVCPFCGEPLASNATFCSKCGRNISGEPDDQQVMPIKSTGRTLVVLSAFALVVGAILPWGTMISRFLGNQHIRGYEGDGIITAALGIVLLIIAAAVSPKPENRYSWLATVIGLVVIVFLLNKWLTLSNIVGGVGDTGVGTISIGTGLYLSLIGGLTALIGGLIKG